MKPFLFLIPAAVAAVILAGTTVDSLEDMEINAGDEVKITCNLEGVQFTWYWIPRYPICAGLKMGQIIICTVTSNRITINEKQDRFQNVILEKKVNLTIPLQHMNDSGIFYCSNGKKNSTFTSVVVKSDDRQGMEVYHHKDSQRVKLTCNPCEEKLEVQAHESSTIFWTINGKKVSNHFILKLRTTITFEFSPPNYGLWQCSDLRCPSQFDGYCLEEDKILERLETKEMPPSTPSPLDMKKKKLFNIQVIGGCVVGFITLLWIGVTIFALREKLRSRRTSPSKTSKEPKSQGSQNSVGIEKPLENQGKEKDIETNEGAEGIQYSVLQFKESEQRQSQKKEGTPAIIYEEMLTNDCSKS